MGLFDFWKNEPTEETRLVEISNDDGDHWVAELPAKGIKQTTDALRDAGATRDTDERDYRDPWAEKFVDRRNSSDYRFKTAPVYDQSIDREPEEDNDTSDDEQSDQKSTWGLP